MASRKILVTGGAGFIGSHLAEVHVGHGDAVTVVDNLENGRVEFAPRGANVLFADVQDSSILKFVNQSGFDVVYHLAAKPRVSFSVDNPSSSNDANVGATVKLLEACRNACGRFILASSSSVYGDTSSYPTSEDVPRNPRSPYALQKMICEDYCGMFADLYGLDVACVRPFNVFGERQLPHGAYSTVITSWLQAVKNRTAMIVDGDGEQLRDFTHVSEAVNVFVALSMYNGRLQGESFNAGSGATVSLNTIKSWFVQAYPFMRDHVQHGPSRVGDVRRTQADMSMSHRFLSWRSLSNFWHKLTETADWAMKNEVFK